MVLVMLAAGFAPAAEASSAATPVLGSSSFAPDSEGFGSAHPRRIFNGGDPSGLVVRIHWRHWGSARSVGVGWTYAFKPQGGYYSQQVRILLRATDLGDCGDGRPAYTRLQYRTQLRPHGPTQQRWHPWGTAPGSACSYS